MININKIIVMGNVARDPELKSLPSGTKICTLSVATNYTYKNTQGEKKEEVEFHNVLVMGKQAESTAQYMKKGSQILIEGRLKTRSWDGADGKKMYRTEVIADKVKFGESPKPEPKPEPKSDTMDYPDDDINADDIPF